MYHSLYDLVIELPRTLASLGKGAQYLDQVVWYEVIDLCQHYTLESPVDLVCFFLTHHFARLYYACNCFNSE